MHMQTESRLELAARQALEAHSHFRGRTRHIHIEDHQGELVLRGSVPTYYLKQVLQEVVRDVGGVQRIDNRVDVCSPRGVIAQSWS